MRGVDDQKMVTQCKNSDLLDELRYLQKTGMVYGAGVLPPYLMPVHNHLKDTKVMLEVHLMVSVEKNNTLCLSYAHSRLSH